MAFNTGNPIGSTSPKDLSDNARDLDLLLLGDDPSYPDRKGVPRKSWKGMEAEHDAEQTRRESEFDTAQAGRVVEFNEFLESSGYETPIDYIVGLSITRTTQQVRYLGELYRPKDNVIPLVTGSNFDPAKWISNGDNALRQELHTPNGGGIVRVQQDDAESLPRDVLSESRDVVRIEQYVSFGDGRDEGAKLQAAIDKASATGRRLEGRPGWTIGTSVQINIPASMSFHFNGMNVVPLGRLSGLHVKISGTAVGVGDIRGLRCVVMPGSVGTLTGVQFGDTSGELSSLSMYDWDILGFDINLKLAGINVFILNFVNCSILSATNRNISYECTSNSGENICFDGGTLSSAHNADNAAVNLFVAAGSSAPDIRLSRLSMSYNDCNGDISTGIVEVLGCHEENKNVREFWRVRNTVGVEKTYFTKVAGTMTPGPLSSGAEPAEGRDAYIIYDGSTSVVVRDVKLGSFRAATGGNQVSDYVTKVAKHSGVGGAALRLRINGNIDANRGTGIPLDLSPETDHAYLTGVGAFDGFTQNTASGMSFASGTDGSGADTRSRSIIGAAAGSNSYNLKLPVRPGQTVLAKVSCKTVGASACTYAGARLVYFTANDVLISVPDFGRVIATPNNAPYVVQFALDKAPAGAAYVIMQMRAAGLTGEVRFSNERIWILD